MKKVHKLSQSGNHLGGDESAVVGNNNSTQGVHAICAAIMGRCCGLKLIDARQMLYAANDTTSGQAEERKD